MNQKRIREKYEKKIIIPIVSVLVLAITSIFGVDIAQGQVDAIIDGAVGLTSLGFIVYGIFKDFHKKDPS